MTLRTIAIFGYIAVIVMAGTVGFALGILLAAIPHDDGDLFDPEDNGRRV